MKTDIIQVPNILYTLTVVNLTSSLHTKAINKADKIMDI